MRKIILLTLITFCFSNTHAQDDIRSSSEKRAGFIDFYWSEKEGKIYLDIEKINEEFLYVNYLSAGVGSNDIGLDRGQIGNQRIVKFIRSGPKLLLIQPNYDFVAKSDNNEEIRSVEEAFAQSVLWGFYIEDERNGKLLIDLTDFLLSDVHGISQTLKQSGQGNYHIDPSRSAMYLPRTKNFKDNTDFESILTFTGTPEGGYIRSVTPTPEAVTVRVHHSFIRLPDDQYKPRKFDPRSGYYAMSYQDYASPIETSLTKRFIYRHRLEKKNPHASLSEPVKPIIYYVDKGAPEPVKSALIEGARWWNQAFEKAGYKNAFQVDVLPDSVDPLDINYNVIQWVHRSTRGWSYGSWIADPRTGEIIKGHVSLGSLRIRQDYLIATGLLQPFKNDSIPPEMLEMALARLRQLSAHEVGHTLGLYHNFAASADGRASVMDYPHPYIQLDINGEIDLSDAYDTGIGEWDEFTIKYGYSDFGPNQNEAHELKQIIDDWIEKGYHFITDSDARPKGGAHPLAHLWDNGKDPASELNRLIKVRKVVLDNFSMYAISRGEPISNIEEVLAPMYFMHRYQVEAAAKLIGGVDYAYKVRGDNLPLPKVISRDAQKAAIKSLTQTLNPEFLSIPKDLLKLLSPKAPGYWRTRESFKSKTGATFDPVTAAETSAEMTFSMIFNAQRMERVIQQHLTDKNQIGWSDILEPLYEATWESNYPDGLGKEIKMAVEKRLFFHLLDLSINDASSEAVKAMANREVENLISKITDKKANDSIIEAHYNHVIRLYSQFLSSPYDFKISQPLSPPDGSPIGMDCMN